MQTLARELVSSGEVFVAEVNIGLAEAGSGLKIEVQVDFAWAGDYFGPLDKPAGRILISPTFRGRGSQEETI